MGMLNIQLSIVNNFENIAIFPSFNILISSI